MSKEIELYERIDAYLNQELSGESLKKFQDELVWNNELKEQVELQQLTNENIIDYRLTKVKALAQSYSEKNPGGSSSTNKYLIGGLLVLAIGGTALYYSFSSKQHSPSVAVERNVERSTASADIAQVPVPEQTKHVSSSAARTSKTKTEQEAVQAIPENTSISSPVATKEIPVETTPKASPVNPAPVAQKEAYTSSPCDQVHVLVSAEAKPSCAGKNNGSLSVINISGGQSPYKIAINGAAYSSDQLYDNLAPGHYNLQVKDNNGCLSSAKKYTVESTACHAVGKYVVSPLEGQLWKIPVDGQSAKLKIVNKAGVLIYSTDIRNGYPEEWDVKDLHNNYPEPGVYLYMLEFSDGHIEQGYITVAM